MLSHEALQAAINGKTVEHAKKLGLAAVTLNKWQAPTLDFSDSGAYNPLDRIETIIETSRALGNPPERYLAPLYYLGAVFGQIIIPAPDAAHNLSELHRELTRLVKEFGDVLSTTGAKTADGNISRRDARAIKKEAYDLQRSLAAFIAKVEEAAGKG